MFYFFLGFAQVALIAVQTRNYSQSRYGMAAIGSVGISSLWWWTVHSMATTQTDNWDALGYIAGNVVGGLCGTWLHKHFAKKKGVDSW